MDSIGFDRASTQWSTPGRQQTSTRAAKYSITDLEAAWDGEGRHRRRLMEEKERGERREQSEIRIKEKEGEARHQVPAPPGLVASSAQPWGLLSLAPHTRT